MVGAVLSTAKEAPPVGVAIIALFRQIGTGAERNCSRPVACAHRIVKIIVRGIGLSHIGRCQRIGSVDCNLGNWSVCHGSLKVAVILTAVPIL